MQWREHAVRRAVSDSVKCGRNLSWISGQAIREGALRACHEMFDWDQTRRGTDTAEELIPIKVLTERDDEVDRRHTNQTGQAMKNTLDVVSQQLERQAVRIVTRKRQSLTLAPQPNEMVYLIRKGLFLARIPMPGDQHHILSILYPGDVIRSSAFRPVEGADVIAASETGEAWRLRWSAVEVLAREDHVLECQLLDSMADLAARLALHSAITAGLTGDERVAAMMVELALRTGKETRSGLTFEMPLSRMDIAEYLALNADTVSRIVSRMRTNGLYAQSPTRDHLACRSISALEDACPLAPALRRMHAAPARPELTV